MGLKDIVLPIAKPIFPVIKRIKAYGKPKIFGIGANKTGTTSLAYAMKKLGFTVGNQREAEKMIGDWAQRDFTKIAKYCKSAQFFQDFPFSLDYTYVYLDQAFPNSKFILTIRDSPEQWYNSLVRFHSKIWGKNGNKPTKKDLMEATYINKGRPWHTNRIIRNTPEDDLYNKEILIHNYRRHNEGVLEYFRHRRQDLLVLNVADDSAYDELCQFLGVEKVSATFPWKNKT